MNDKNQEKLALEIATKAHEGQTRWDGSPYINHPIAVANKMTHECLKAAALLHDVLEDSELTYSDLLNAGVYYLTVNVVVALTKKKGQSYKDYLEQVASNQSAIVVKLADLEHNLSDLKPGKMRDKYEAATLYLKAMQKIYQLQDVGD